MVRRSDRHLLLPSVPLLKLKVPQRILLVRRVWNFLSSRARLEQVDEASGELHRLGG